MYALSKRVKAVLHYEHVCASVRKVAHLYGVGKSTVARWVRLGIDDLKLASTATRRRRRARKVPELEAFVTETLSADPFADASAIKSSLSTEFGISLSNSTVVRARKRAGFRFKVARRSQQKQPVDPTHPFLATRDQYTDAIAVDESSFVSLDIPRRGWARTNEHVAKPAPRQRKRVSLLLAIDSSGVVGHELRSGSFNSDSYAAFLRTLPQGRRVIADNVSFHKSRKAYAAASEKSLLLTFTPPYCPWFNPVEFAFSTTKRAYRRARVISESNFMDDVKASLSTLSAESCAGFFRHAERNVSIELARAAGKQHIQGPLAS